MQRQILTVVLTALLVLGSVSCTRSDDTEPAPARPETPVQSTTEEVRPVAPDFTLKEITGITRKLSDYEGQPVLLVFTTTWCPYCKKQIPELKKIHETYAGDDFTLLAVYVQESPKRVSAFIKERELPYPILLDPEGKIARQYNVRGVPTHVLVGRDGTIICYNCPELEGKIKEALKK